MTSNENDLRQESDRLRAERDDAREKFARFWERMNALERCHRCKAPETHATGWLGGNYGWVRYCQTCATALGAQEDPT